ncbi:MAG: toll/interleukin-1 receptor domain-containing protein [Chloroflexi bacterium]|nr:toll/interleukin-1 receptor domain-containing protein [Chloroflexota bacterium]
MQRVFISYSRQYLTFAERPARDLDDAGLDVWLVVRQITGGQQWRDAIFKGIDQAQIVIVGLSPPAVESESMRREILVARSQHKLIIPMMVKDAQELMKGYEETAHLLDVQIIDFEDRYERAFPEQLRALPGIQPIEPSVDTDAIDPAPRQSNCSTPPRTKS